MARVDFDPNKQMGSTVWTILAADPAATLAEIEDNEISNKMLDYNIADPGRLIEKSSIVARKIFIKKYWLSENCKSIVNEIGYLGIHSTPTKGGYIHITVADGFDKSMVSLVSCLNENINGAPLIPGCLPNGRE